MRFDYTNGKSAQYIVSRYSGLTEDHMYFHYYGEAKKMYDKLEKTADRGVTVSLYDMIKDVRKAFHKA